MEIKDILFSKVQDAINWKAKAIWSSVSDPDKEVDATNQIVSMLFCIKNQIKRDRYTSTITSNINQFAKDREDQANDIKRQISKLEKSSKPNIELIQELTAELEKANELLLPKIKETNVKAYLKDLQKSKLTFEKAKAIKEREVKTSLSPEDIGLPEGFEGDFNAAVNYGIYEDDNKYFIKSSRDNWNQVSTFTMKVHYLVRESIESAYRVITFTNHYGQERTLTINTDDLTSAGPFKKVVNRLSNFSWQGKDEDLAKLNEYLQRDEKHAMQLNILGLNSRYKFWAWGNGLLDLSDNPEFIPADEFGMVQSKSGETFFIPAANKLNSLTDDVQDVSPEARFCFTDTKMGFTEWSTLHQMAYGENSMFGVLWYLASLYRDVIFGHPAIKRFPSLFAYGTPGSGKGSFTNSILSLNGFPQNSISLESNTSTPKGILRSFTQFKNGIVWLDEYKNAIPKYLIALLKQLYDGASYARAKKTNDAKTESTPINASAIVSGQDMPTIEAALLERFILLQFNDKKRTNEEITAFNALAELEEDGLSTIAHQVLVHRNHFVSKFKELFKTAFTEMREELSKKEIKDRYQMNFAILLAVYDVLKDKLKFPYNRKKVVEQLIKKAIEQSSLSKNNNDIAKFWAVVEFLVGQGFIIQDKNYAIREGILHIKIQDVHPLYVKECKARGDNFALDKSTLENYIRSDKGLFREQTKMRIGGFPVHVYSLNYDIIESRYGVSFNLKAHLHEQNNEELIPEIPNNDLLRKRGEVINNDMPFE